MAIRIAQEHDIPVLNLGLHHSRAVCERLEEMRIAALRTVPATAPMEVGEAR